MGNFDVQVGYSRLGCADPESSNPSTRLRLLDARWSLSSGARKRDPLAGMTTSVDIRE
jgi:hypothetical protein